jgi:hypothetical protein
VLILNKNLDSELGINPQGIIELSQTNLPARMMVSLVVRRRFTAHRADASAQRGRDLAGKVRASFLASDRTYPGKIELAI